MVETAGPPGLKKLSAQSERPTESQVARGVLVRKTNRVPLKCVILSVGWPSWAYSLDACNVECVLIRVCDLETQWIALLKQCYLNLNIESVATMAKLWDPGGCPKPRVILAQGPKSMLAWGRSEWADDAVVLHSAASRLQDKEPDSTSWTRLDMSAVQSGGVLCGDWNFYCNSNASFGEHAENRCRRRLRHVMDSVTSGALRAVDAPHNDDLLYDKVWFMEDGKTLDWNGTLPRCSPLSRVRCRSVFVSTKWTIRGLSARELCSAYDVPIGLSRGFKDWQPAQRHELPFLRAAPSKLLRWHEEHRVERVSGFK